MWYRLGTEGSMESGWVKEESDGYWYFLDGSGAMRTGWVLIHGIWYYFNPVTQGNTGWQKTEDGKWGHQTGESGSRPVGAFVPIPQRQTGIGWMKTAPGSGDQFSLKEGLKEGFPSFGDHLGEAVL